MTLPAPTPNLAPPELWSEMLTQATDADVALFAGILAMFALAMALEQWRIRRTDRRR